MHPENIIADEPAWRVPHQTSAAASSASKVIATRWRAGSEQTLEFGAETAADCHVVKIVLRTMNIRFSVSGGTVQDGVTKPGTVHVNEPALPVHCAFHGHFRAIEGDQACAMAAEASHRLCRGPPR